MQRRKQENFRQHTKKGEYYSKHSWQEMRVNNGYSQALISKKFLVDSNSKMNYNMYKKKKFLVDSNSKMNYSMY